MTRSDADILVAINLTLLRPGGGEGGGILPARTLNVYGMEWKPLFNHDLF